MLRGGQRAQRRGRLLLASAPRQGGRGPRPRIAAGIAASTRASRLGCPTAASIAGTSRSRADVAVGEHGLAGWVLRAAHDSGARRTPPLRPSRATPAGAAGRRGEFAGQPVWRFLRRARELVVGGDRGSRAALRREGRQRALDLAPDLADGDPETPWPPRTRSMTSSSLVHSYTLAPSLMRVRSPGPRRRARAGGRRRYGCSAARPRCRAAA